MKILITHELFPPDFTGGGERLNYRIAKELIDRGHSVKVVTTGDPKIKKYEDIETIRIPINRYMMNMAVYTIFQNAKDVDIIHTNSGNSCFPSWLAAKILGKPILCYVNHILGHYWSEIRGPIVGRVFESVERFVLNKSYDAIIFQNNASKKLGIDIGIDKKRIFMLQPGIDFKKYHMKNIKKEPFVLFVGNLSMNEVMCNLKGVKYLIEAARKLKDINFVIVGEGDYLHELKKTSPSNVIFKGATFGESLIKLYNQALIFCLPSLNEGFGLSILEAMASGCAIASTIDIGQKGISLRPESVNEIVNSVKYLINNRKKAMDVGKKNRELSKEYTWDNFIKKLTNIYESIL